MSTNKINFNKVIAYSRVMCAERSRALCATYVKRAFEEGGCKYITGNGWYNQRWCQENNFRLIGDFVPVDRNPRAHNGMPIQFPEGYVQQIGDVCLIKHGDIGHICYATGVNINDWVSDYFQCPPGQQDGTGPYCYQDNIERVQFWRHESVLNNAPVINSINIQQDTYMVSNIPSGSQTVTPNIPGVSNSVQRLADAAKYRDNILKQDDARKAEFESLRNRMTTDSPEMGREILITAELYDSNILKGSQESRKERS